MAARFELVSKYAGQEELLPVRKTAESAGYDFVVAEDITIPPLKDMYESIEKFAGVKTLEEIAKITKETKTKFTLVPTGVCCKLDPGTYLELSVRSSCPLKHWLIMANSVGIIDGDYYHNPDNEGHIFFQMINLSPFTISLKKGDTIGQGIIKPYLKTENDQTIAERVGGFGSTDSH